MDHTLTEMASFGYISKNLGRVLKLLAMGEPQAQVGNGRGAVGEDVGAMVGEGVALIGWRGPRDRNGGVRRRT